MELPTDKPFVEDEFAYYWMDEDLLCSISKPTPRAIEHVVETFELIRRVTGGEKVCLMADISATGYRSEGARITTAHLCTENFIAMAMIANTSFGRLTGNTFMSVSGSPVPMKLCTTESEARDWLKQFQKKAAH